MADLPQLLAQDTVRAAQVEDAAGGTIAEPGEYAPVGAAGVDLELVGLARERQLARAQPHAVEPVLRRVDEDIPGVPQPVDVTDLVAVIGGDGDLADPLRSLVELHDDLAVEVEPVGVALERDVAQGGDAVGAVAGMPFAEVGADHRVLNRREDPVPDVLVQGHAAAPRRATVDHARPEDRVALVALQRRDHLREELRRVLTVAVHEHDDVEVVLRHTRGCGRGG